MNIRYRVELSQTERDELKALLSGGRHAARKLKRAQILLAADAGASDERSRGASGWALDRLSDQAPLRAWQPGAALSEEPVLEQTASSPAREALLVATACSSPPEGRARWTLELRPMNCQAHRA